MIVVVTPSNFDHCLVIVDLEADKSRWIPTPDCMKENYRPFGMTWDKDLFYVANPTRIVAFSDFEKPPEVYIDNLPYGTHQIQYYDRNLWMVSPRTEGVLVCDTLTDECRHFDPIYGDWNDEIEEVTDENHYNSIHFGNKYCYILAHNLGKPSYLHIFETYGMVLSGFQKLNGTQCHCVCEVENGDVVYLDSKGGKIRSLQAPNLLREGINFQVGKEGEYVRGLGVTDDYFVVGIMQAKSDRKSRHEGGSRIAMVERETGKVVHEYRLERSGSINDLRILDVPDLAHGRPPYMPTVKWF